MRLSELKLPNDSKINQYIRRQSKVLLDGEFPLNNLNMNELEGIQKGIPILENVTMPQVKFLSNNLDTINMIRGCIVGCDMCLKNAPKTIKTVLWNDLDNLTSGFKELGERLGINVLNGNKHITPVDDANPSDFPIFDLQGNKHSVFSGLKLFFDRLNIPSLIVTSGWDKSNNFAQKSADQFVKDVKMNPELLSSLQISINPFTKANDYNNRMANTLATFLDLFKGKTPKASLIYRHADNTQGHEKINELALSEIYKDIYAKLKVITGTALEDCPTLDPDEVTKFKPEHLIEPTGRGRKFFSPEYNLKKQQDLISEKLYWDSLTPEQRADDLFKNSLKCIDINGKIYTITPSCGNVMVNTPSELIVPTNIQLNYINNQSHRQSKRRNFW